MTTMFTHEALSVVEHASTYLDVFPDEASVVAVYRDLAKELHPDRFGNDGIVGKKRATEIFQLLNDFKREADQMIAEGRWGERAVLATIQTKKASHQIIRKIGEDSLTLHYRATSSPNGPTLIRMAKSPKDNDLVAQEARALKKLHSEDHQLNRHFPPLYDTFLHSEGRRRANVTPTFEHFLTLEEIHQRFPEGMDPRHVVWIFRRLLMGLGRAHDLGLVHGAVTPDSILIGAADHAVVLTNWCYSVVIDSESKTHIKAVVPMYRTWYPEEVLAKEPPTPATDLYMAARVMIELFHMGVKQDMIKPLRTFFRGTMLAKQSMRPQSAWALLAEFDEMLKMIGEPFYPRRWVEFAVPPGTASK